MGNTFILYHQMLKQHITLKQRIWLHLVLYFKDIQFLTQMDSYIIITLNLEN